MDDLDTEPCPQCDADTLPMGGAAYRCRACGWTWGTLTRPDSVSDTITTSGGTFYRNKRGRCEDAPCCGCCTI